LALSRPADRQQDGAMLNETKAIPQLVRSPAELKAARHALGLSAAGLAHMVRVEGGGRTVRRWEAGEREIPGPVTVVMETAMHFLRQRDDLTQQLEAFQSGKMHSGSMSWGHQVVDTTADNIVRLVDAQNSLEKALEILTRQPPTDPSTPRQVHWYSLKRATPKYPPPEKDEWSIPGETSCEAALAYFEKHVEPDLGLELCEEGDLNAEFLLEKREVIRTQRGASQWLQPGAVVATLSVRRA
jgi:DNA-binding transcriptional regulator YiaG